MKKAKVQKGILFVIILIVLILFLIPFYILVLNTFKPTSQFLSDPFGLPDVFDLSNYTEAIERMNFWVALGNTAVITVVATLLNTLVSSMTGYFFARKRWKVNKLLFSLMLASMVAPFQVYMIPLVKIYGGTLGLSNNLMLVAYIAAALNIPFAVFLYNGGTPAPGSSD